MVARPHSRRGLLVTALGLIAASRMPGVSAATPICVDGVTCPATTGICLVSGSGAGHCVTAAHIVVTNGPDCAAGSARVYVPRDNRDVCVVAAFAVGSWG